MPIYYSSKNELLDTKNYSYFNSGKFSDIYKNGNTLLKIYRDEIKYRYYISKKIFLLLKKYNIPNLVRLKDYYHSFDGRIEKMLPMDAYTMEYVDDKKVKLLDMDREYLLGVANKLEETLDELSKRHILIEDSHEGNILFTENGVTILDPDQFLNIPFLPGNYVYQLNKEKVIKAMNDTIITEYYDKKNQGFINLIEPKIGNSLTGDISSFLVEDKIRDSIKKNLVKSI